MWHFERKFLNLTSVNIWWWLENKRNIYLLMKCSVRILKLLVSKNAISLNPLIFIMLRWVLAKIKCAIIRKLHTLAFLSSTISHCETLHNNVHNSPFPQIYLVQLRIWIEIYIYQQSKQNSSDFSMSHILKFWCT